MRVNIEASSQGTSGQHRTGLDTCWGNVENIRKQSQSMCYHGQGCILASSKQQSQTLLKRAASTKKLPRCFPCLKTKISCNKPGELTSKQFTKPRSFMEAKMPTPCPPVFASLFSYSGVVCSGCRQLIPGRLTSGYHISDVTQVNSSVNKKLFLSMRDKREWVSQSVFTSKRKEVLSMI